MFTPEELRALEEAGTRSVDVAQFVPLAAVDPVYFERTYYLEAAIQRKVEGRQVTVAEPGPTPPGNVVDLMSALKASLERDSRRPPQRAPAKAAGRAHARARRKSAHS
jgi:non-homologous end joining protein Ku